MLVVLSLSEVDSTQVAMCLVNRTKMRRRRQVVTGQVHTLSTTVHGRLMTLRGPPHLPLGELLLRTRA